MIYVDPATGEIHEEWREGLVEVDLDDPPARPDHEWLGDWYTQQLARLEAERAAIKAQTAKRMAELSARERALEWRWGPTLREVVAEALLGARRKSVDYAYGRCGFRRSRRVEVRDEAAALEWARTNAPAAVKVTESLLKSQLPEDAPGLEVVERDEFYARPA